MRRMSRFFCLILWSSFILSFLVVVPLLAQQRSTADTRAKVARLQEESEGEDLIDFSLLAVDQDSSLEIDFSDMASYYGFSEQDKSLMKIDLTLKNWEIVVPSSSKEIFFQYPSFLAPADIKANSIIFAGQKVLGVRLFFPPKRTTSYSVLPPFPIPFYSGSEGNQFLNKGVVKNVGAIKEIQLETYGQYQQVAVSLVLEDMYGKTMEIPFGDLNFSGWRRIVWQNPNYKKSSLDNIVNPKRDNPIMPPSYRFKELVFKHSEYDRVADIVAFVKSIKIIYDKSVNSEMDEIDTQEFWRNYYGDFESNGFPDYKKYILERFLVKRRQGQLQNKKSFIKADPIITADE